MTMTMTREELHGEVRDILTDYISMIETETERGIESISPSAHDRFYRMQAEWIAKAKTALKEFAYAYPPTRK